MNDITFRRTIAVCDTAPIVIEGIRALVDACPDLSLAGAERSLPGGMEMVRALGPDVVLIDKSFGNHAVMDWTRELVTSGCATAPVVWGTVISGQEGLRLMRAGARGVMRKTADIQSVIECIRTVAQGRTWLEAIMLQDTDSSYRRRHPNLTIREQEVLELIEQGLRNKEIAQRMGIQPGTVKIHLKHIFEKTGIRGRYGLALNGLKEKGLLTLSAV